jgi:hypothetical protein
MMAHGRHQAVFGTQYPMLTPGECLQELDLPDLDDRTGAPLLGGNARRSFAR